MIDTHTHILPHVDDGPNDIQQSLIILQQAVKQGITGMIVTPHSFHSRYHVPYETLNIQKNRLQAELLKHNIPITLYAGHEVFLTESILHNDTSSHIHTLAHSKYLLLELPNHFIPMYVIESIRKLLTNHTIPVIAHPERNRSLKERPQLLQQLIQLGAVAQVCADSLAGQYGRSTQKFALSLIRANLVHLYGSDVHNTTTRPLLFEQGLAVLEKNKCIDALEMLLENNATIIRHEPLRIEQMDGITVHNTIDFYVDGEHFPIGDMQLDGDRALQYVRMRYDDPNGDFGRQARQKQVIEQLILKTLSIKSLLQYEKIFKQIEKNVKVNATFLQLLNIQKKLCKKLQGHRAAFRT